MNKKFKYKKLFLVVILSVILLVGCDGGGFGSFFDMLFVDFGIGFLLEVKFDLILNLELMFELMLDLEFMLELIFDFELILELELEFVFMKMGYLILGGSQWVIGVICNGEFSDGFIFKFGEDVICVVGNMIIVIFNIQLEVVCSLCVVEKVLFSFEDV